MRDLIFSGDLDKSGNPCPPTVLGVSGHAAREVREACDRLITSAEAMTRMLADHVLHGVPDHWSFVPANVINLSQASRTSLAA